MPKSFLSPEELIAMLAGRAQDAQEDKPSRPARPEEIADLIHGARNMPILGDKVKWRSAGLQYLKYPTLEEVVVVTNVFPVPSKYFDEPEKPLATIAVAMVHECGNPMCEYNGHVFEIPVDGRRFRRIGTTSN